MVSATAEYALRAVLLLAQLPRGASLRADEIADSIGAPRNYLSKTLRTLAHERLIGSARGPKGGFRITIDPDRMMLSRVVDLFDGLPDDTQCLLTDCSCTRKNPCAVNAWWQGIQGCAHKELEGMSVSGLLRSRKRTNNAGAARKRVRARTQPAR